MREIQRKNYPFYGIFKYKISISLDKYRISTKTTLTDICVFLETLGEKNYKFRDQWSIYLKDKTHYDAVMKKFPHDIVLSYVPAPGYENLVGRQPKTEPKLWYSRFPIKITMKINKGESSEEYSKWCAQNLNHDFRMAGSSFYPSFFFINASDALAFKLNFAEKIIKTNSIKTAIAKKLLNDRIKLAKNDLKIFEENMQGDLNE